MKPEKNRRLDEWFNVLKTESGIYHRIHREKEQKTNIEMKGIEQRTVERRAIKK